MNPGLLLKLGSKLFTPGGNPLARPVASLSHLFAPAIKTAQNVAKGVDNLLSSHTVYAGTPKTPQTKPQANIAAALAAFGHNETRGVKGDPYKFAQNSGDPKLGRALGKYQVTEELVKRLGPKYLGSAITSDQFLASSTLQDKFQSARIQNLLDQGYTLQQIADYHRHGSTNLPGSTEYRRPRYVGEFDRAYQKFSTQNPPTGQK